MSFFQNLAALVGSVPGVGKHKTVIGAVGLAAGSIFGLAGEAEIGMQINQFATLFLGVGLADKARKNRASVKVTGRF